MNKRQAQNYVRLCGTLGELGLDDSEIDALLRCERTLTRWSCRECGDGSNWAIERDEASGIPYEVYHGPDIDYSKPLPQWHRRKIADRETAALTRAEAIAARHGLTIYHQGDPRGCALYVIRPGDVPEGKCVTGYYTSGIAVCID